MASGHRAMDLNRGSWCGVPAAWNGKGYGRLEERHLRTFWYAFGGFGGFGDGMYVGLCSLVVMFGFLNLTVASFNIIHFQHDI